MNKLRKKGISQNCKNTCVAWWISEGILRNFPTLCILSHCAWILKTKKKVPRHISESLTCFSSSYRELFHLNETNSFEFIFYVALPLTTLRRQQMKISIHENREKMFLINMENDGGGSTSLEGVWRKIYIFFGLFVKNI